MARARRLSLRCVLLAPLGEEFEPVRRIIMSAGRDAGFHMFAADDTITPTADTAFSEIARADLVVALVSYSASAVYYEIGLAHALGKPIVSVIEEDIRRPLFAVPYIQTFSYSHSTKGLSRLNSVLRKAFEDFKREPQRFARRSPFAVRPTPLPVVDLDRLEPREFENLCFELLTQMGFRRVEWGKQSREFDAVATLPKKDPDGFEYSELWLISMGIRAPSGMLLDMARDPEYFLHRMLRPRLMERLPASSRLDMPITLLLIEPPDDRNWEVLQQQWRRAEQRSTERPTQAHLRVRFWDRQQLAVLIQQYPQIAYKYSAEEGRDQSKFRKSYEQLSLEYASLSEERAAAIKTATEERDKRVRAERDAVWKDVAFTAAHKLGNPIFALETNLQGIKRSITSQPAEALKLVGEMADSIEKAKLIIQQFKSLTKAQEISPRPVDLVPLLKSASRVVADNGVKVQVTATSDGALALADPVRMTECFDELFANALHWLSKPEKRISVTVGVAKKGELPPDLDDTKAYVRVRIEDNGCGIPPDKKEEIFAPFYTTYPHGTGLGLALVQRVLERHGGAIREVGKLGDGAMFEIFLPRAEARRQGS